MQNTQQPLISFRIKRKYIPVLRFFLDQPISPLNPYAKGRSMFVEILKDATDETNERRLKYLAEYNLDEKGLPKLDSEHKERTELVDKLTELQPLIDKAKAPKKAKLKKEYAAIEKRLTEVEKVITETSEQAAKDIVVAAKEYEDWCELPWTYFADRSDKMARYMLKSVRKVMQQTDLKLNSENTLIWEDLIEQLYAA